MHKLYYSDYCAQSRNCVALEYRYPQEEFPEHYHDFNEIFIVDGGSGIHVLNDYPYSVNSGMFFYLNARDRHLFEQVEDLKLVNILYRSEADFSFIRNFSHLLPKEEDGCVWNIGLELKKQALSLLAELNRHVDNDPIIESCRRENLFLRILLLLRNSRYRINQNDSNQDKLQQLLLFLQQNRLEEINWEALSHQFYLTPRTLHRQFVSQTGQTPQKYLNNLRLNRAKCLLKISDRSLTDIAFFCGFGDSNNFSTLFKKAFGISPSQMRRRYSLS
jgi:AraC family L-rhamnose operon regulatory protein RhaS